MTKRSPHAHGYLRSIIPVVGSFMHAAVKQNHELRDTILRFIDCMAAPHRIEVHDKSMPSWLLPLRRYGKTCPLSLAHRRALGHMSPNLECGLVMQDTNVLLNSSLTGNSIGAGQKYLSSGSCCALWTFRSCPAAMLLGPVVCQVETTLQRYSRRPSP